MNKFRMGLKPRRLARIAYAVGLMSLVLTVMFGLADGNALASPLD